MLKKIIILGVAAAVAGTCYVACDKVEEGVYQATTNDNDKVAKVVRDQQKKEAHRQNIEWTAENKAKYPLEFLWYQSDELDKAIEVLKAQKVIHLQNQANYKIKVENAKDIIAQNEKTIELIQNAVKAAKESGAEVVRVNNLTMTKEETARNFSLAKTKLESTRERLHDYEVALARATKEVNANAAKLAEAAVSKEKLQSAIERVKTQKESTKLENVNVSVDVTLASLGIEDSTQVSLEDLQDSAKGASAESQAYKDLWGE